MTPSKARRLFQSKNCSSIETQNFVIFIFAIMMQV